MAISYVGGNSGHAQNAGSVTVSLTALTGGSDSSPSTDDLILVAWSCGDDDFTQPTLAMTTSGYTELTTSTLSVDGGAGGDGNLAVFYKFHNGSDTSVQTAASGTGTDSSNAVAVMVFRGVALVADGGPLEITIQTATGASGGDPDPPQVSGFTEATNWVVIAGATSDTGGVTPTLTAPANYTTDAVLVANDTEATIRGAAGLAYRTDPADPENPGAFTSGGDAWAAATMVLKMAPVTVTGVALSATPELPAATLNHGLTGVVLDLVPSLPAATLNHGVTGVALTMTPTLPVAAVSGGAGVETGWDEVGRWWSGIVSETGEYPAGTDKVSETGVYLFSLQAAGGVTITGVALEMAPSLPAGSLQHSLTGIVLDVTPSLPAATLNHSLTGVALSMTPSLPAGSLAHSLSGVALSATPTLPAATLVHTLTGTVLTVTPTLPAGALTHTITGVALSLTPSLPAGTVSAGAQFVTGVALEVTPSLPAGALRHTLTGVALSATPTLPAATLDHKLTGVTITVTPSLPAGTLNHSLSGVALSLSPSLPAAALSHSLTGVVLVVTIELPAGALTSAGDGQPVKGPTRAEELAGPADAEALAGPPRAALIGAGHNTMGEL